MLRHAPESIGIVLEPAGWVGVDDLLRALAGDGLPLTREELDHVVASNDKQRFAFDAAGTRVRASQGHSVPVELGYAPQRPPDLLFHGTPTRNLEAVLRQGLLPGSRHAVHLSADVDTATSVGARRGRCAVLQVDAAAMVADGAAFSRSANGVWLVAAVPPCYVSVAR